MVFCTYKVRNLEGESLRGKCWCSSKHDLAKTFRNRGYYLIKYSEVTSKGNRLFIRRLSAKELSIFCSQFSSLLDAGINISEVIHVIKEEANNKSLKNSLSDIEEMINQGMELSQSMRLFKSIYPKFFIDMIKIGEESGNLDNIFKRLIKYYNDENLIKTKITKAMLYPCTILIFSVVVMNIMIFNIVPIFISTLTELGGTIPSSTKIIMFFTSAIRDNLYILILFFILILSLCIWIFNIKNIKLALHKFIISNFIIGKLGQKILSVKFSRIMGTLISSGIQIIPAINITSNMIDNYYAKTQIEKIIDTIKRGNDIAKSMSNTGLFPPMLCSMIRVGEDSGKLDDMLMKSSSIMEGDLYNFIDKISALIEPAMIIILSVFIGFILISLLMPMINIMNSF